jgi:hypothetical protein
MKKAESLLRSLAQVPGSFRHRFVKESGKQELWGKVRRDASGTGIAFRKGGA